MERALMRPRLCALVLTLALALVGAAIATPSDAARPRDPSVDIQSAASLAPDGSRITVSLIASCPERWTVVEAFVDVSLPQASGRGSFALACTGAQTPLTVQVTSLSGVFELGDARASATLRIRHGRTETTTDTADVSVQPGVDVRLTGGARLDGADVLMGIIVGCPVGSTGAQSYVNVTSLQGSGTGFYVPECDGVTRTITIRVQPSQGSFVPGMARALTFANVVYQATSFSGVADSLIEIGA